jgi:hypothetical protein
VAAVVTIYGMMDQRTVMDDTTGVLSLDQRLANLLLRFLWAVHEGGKKLDFPADFDASLTHAQAQLQVCVVVHDG